MFSIKRILVATDFSEPSVQAAGAGRRLAELFGAEVHVVHVVEQIAGYANLRVTGTEAPPLLRTFVDDARERLLAFATQQLGDLPAEHRHLRVGRPAEEICRAAQDCSADLIVVGTVGAGGVARALLGSVAEKVISSALIPVLSLKTAPRLESGIRLLLATDLSESSRLAAKVAEGLAVKLQGRVTVLGVLEPPNRLAFWKMVPAESRDQAQTRLLAELETFVQSTFDASTPRELMVRCGDVDEEVVASARELPADLLFMGVNGQAGVARWRLGSVVNRVLHRCPIAMITARTA